MNVGSDLGKAYRGLLRYGYAKNREILVVRKMDQTRELVMGGRDFKM